MSYIDAQLAHAFALPLIDMGFTMEASPCGTTGTTAAVVKAAPKGAAWPRAKEHVDMHLATDWFQKWFAGSYVTCDGKREGKPLMAFRGCGEGQTDIAPDGVAFWLTSSRLNASYFEDGEMQNCYVRLLNPLVVTAVQLRASGMPVSALVSCARAHVQIGLANWDGVILEDVLDGTHRSTVYAVFPKGGTVSHAVQIVGYTWYSDEDGAPEFYGLQPSEEPVTFGRMDEMRSPPMLSQALLAPNVNGINIGRQRFAAWALSGLSP